MPEIDFDQLGQAWQNVQRGTQLNLLDLSRPYSFEALIRAFLQIRTRMLTLITPLNDAQVQFKPAPEEFSIGEVISHVVAAQGGVYNALLDLTNIVMPFILHVPEGPGAGARNTLGQAALLHDLQEATDEMVDLIRQVARDDEPAIREYPFFGRMSPKAWLLFQLYHEMDHAQQAESVFRLSAFPARQPEGVEQAGSTGETPLPQA